ncbi:MAG: radical SAM protein [Candidatus Delongbacteria bacterium]|jgi:uncharacterized protein|nr:radical SAM protein [Candidatus Delongbacteria bacterium]
MDHKILNNGTIFYKNILFKQNGDYLNRTLEFIDNKVNLTKDDKKFNILRAVIHITNTCNFACKYCYASGGNYGEKDSIMDKETAIKIISLLNNNYPDIKVVHFFGGEPLLNLDILEFFCSKLKNKKFTLITNGSIFNDKISKIIKKYKIDITISLDGPKIINDANRVYKSGKGTYSIVTENIKRFQKETMQPKSIEGAITNETLRQISLIELYKWILQEFNIQLVHFPYVSVSSNYDKRINYKVYTENYLNLVDFIFLNLISENKNKIIVDYFIVGLISGIVLKSKLPSICPAGSSTISFSSKGDIYPCFMLNEKKEFKLSSLEEFDNKSFTENRKKFAKGLDKSLVLSGNTNWYLPSLQYCAAAIYEDQKTFIPPKEELKFFELVFEKVLNYITSIREKEYEYKNLVNNLRYINKTYRDLQYK